MGVFLFLLLLLFGFGFGLGGFFVVLWGVLCSLVGFFDVVFVGFCFWFLSFGLVRFGFLVLTEVRKAVHDADYIPQRAPQRSVTFHLLLVQNRAGACPFPRGSKAARWDGVAARSVIGCRRHAWRAVIGGAGEARKRRGAAVMAGGEGIGAGWRDSDPAPGFDSDSDSDVGSGTDPGPGTDMGPDPGLDTLFVTGLGVSPAPAGPDR